MKKLRIAYLLPLLLALLTLSSVLGSTTQGTISEDSFFAKDYEAKWIDQFQASQYEGNLDDGDEYFDVTPGDTVDFWAKLENIGNNIWFNNGEDREFTFAIYKDPKVVSGPQGNFFEEDGFGFDTPGNQSFGTSYFIDEASWVSQYRIGTIENEEVNTGEQAIVRMRFRIPDDALPGRYREDISAASGPFWVANGVNGDPLGVMHIWVGFDISLSNISPQPTIASPSSSLYFANNVIVVREKKNRQDLRTATAEYFDGTTWKIIGTDYAREVDSNKIKRDFAIFWNTSKITTGRYPIKVTITDILGHSGIVEGEILVGKEPVIGGFDVEFDEDSGALSITATGTVDPDGFIETYQWSLDGVLLDDFDQEFLSLTIEEPLEPHIILLDVIDTTGLATTNGVVLSEGQVFTKRLPEAITMINLQEALLAISREKIELLGTLTGENFEKLNRAIQEMHDAFEDMRDAWEKMFRDPPDLAGARADIEKAKEDIRDAINKLTEIGGAQMLANVRRLQLIWAELTMLSGKLWLLEQIGPTDPHIDITPIPVGGVSQGGADAWPHYTGQTPEIVIPPNRAYSESVILHEYDHYILHQKNGDALPGGDHSICGQTTPELAWSEGWANFSQAAKRGEPTYGDPTWTRGDVDIERGRKNGPDNVVGNADDYDCPPRQGDPPRIVDGHRNEVAVAGVLWDLIDSGAKDTNNDGINLDFKWIWKAINAEPHPRTINDFYNNLKRVLQDNNIRVNQANFDAVFRNHGVAV